VTLARTPHQGPSLADALGAVADAHALASWRHGPLPELERERSALVGQARSGRSADMAFTFRRPARSTSPVALLPGARSVVAVALAFSPSEAPAPTVPSGRVARYSWRDRYRELDAALGAMADVLEQQGWRAQVLSDDNRLLDKAVAVALGLGWYGRQTLVLVPGAGSWALLGSVVSDAPPPSADAPRPHPPAVGCGSCRRCLDACPTGALVAPGVLDARRCLAWLLQSSKPLPTWARPLLGDRLYGCDTCQDVCPVNQRMSARRPARTSEEDEPWVDLAWVLEASDGELLERLGRWYVPRRDPSALRRNALVVAGNVLTPPLDARFGRLLAQAAHHHDAAVREAARWATERLCVRAEAG